MTRALTGGVFGTSNATDDFADLRRLAEDIGTRSFDERIGHRTLPDAFDHTAWRHLEDAGLTRLTSDPESGGGPAELALVLPALDRFSQSAWLVDTAAGWPALGGCALQAALYTTLLVAATMFDFYRRNL